MLVLSAPGNLVIAFASPHRREGCVVCQYVVKQFEQKLPGKKKETYQEGSVK
jgi:molybdopterin synthase catalytic subunit